MKEVIKIKGGGTITLENVENDYIKRQLQKVARNGNDVSVFVAEGESLLILKQLSTLSYERYSLSKIRRDKGLIKEIPLKDLMLFEGILDEIITPLKKTESRYRILWNKIAAMKRRKREENSEKKPKKSLINNDDNNNEDEESFLKLN